jgi:hypothetical protein
MAAVRVLCQRFDVDLMLPDTVALPGELRGAVRHLPVLLGALGPAERLRAWERAVAGRLAGEGYAAAHATDTPSALLALARGLRCVLEAEPLLGTGAGLPVGPPLEAHRAQARQCLASGARLVARTQAAAAQLAAELAAPAGVELLPPPRQAGPGEDGSRLLAFYEALLAPAARPAPPVLSLLGRPPAPPPGTAAPLPRGGEPLAARPSLVAPPALPRPGAAAPGAAAPGAAALPRIGGGGVTPPPLASPAPALRSAPPLTGAGPPPLAATHRPPPLPPPLPGRSGGHGGGARPGAAALGLARQPLPEVHVEEPELVEGVELLEAEAWAASAPLPAGPSVERVLAAVVPAPVEDEVHAPLPPEGWLAQALLGYCPPGRRHFARHAPPTNFPGREGLSELAGSAFEPES